MINTVADMEELSERTRDSAPDPQTFLAEHQVDAQATVDFVDYRLPHFGDPRTYFAVGFTMGMQHESERNNSA